MYGSTINLMVEAGHTYSGIDVQMDICFFTERFANPNINILHRFGPWSLEDITGKTPAWMKPFKDRGITPDGRHSVMKLMKDERFLIALEIPRQYDAILMERERVIDANGDKALIERCYLTGTPDQPESLYAVSALVRRIRVIWDWQEPTPISHLFTQFADLRETEKVLQVQNIIGLINSDLPLWLWHKV